MKKIEQLQKRVDLMQKNAKIVQKILTVNTTWVERTEVFSEFTGTHPE
jgi:hypothetical protein